MLSDGSVGICSGHGTWEEVLGQAHGICSKCKRSLAQQDPNCCQVSLKGPETQAAQHADMMALALLRLRRPVKQKASHYSPAIQAENLQGVGGEGP